jgi:polar amino acid transport system permease protein
MNPIDILITYFPAFIEGLAVTMKLCLIIWSTGIIGGAALGIAAARYPEEFGWPVRAASFFVQSMPLLVLLFWLHYPAQAVFNVVIDPFITAAFTFAIVNMFGVAELIRGAIVDFPKQYLTAAKVTGLDAKTTVFKIQLPLIFREVLPPLLILQVTMLHCTLFASLISVEEIFRVAQRINAQIYKPVEIYTALGLFFVAVCIPITLLAAWLKHRFTRDLSER